MLSRRSFLQTASIVSLSPTLPGVFANTARAAGAAPDAPVLVVIQLDGGNDGLNTVAPFADDAYARARDKLRLDAKELHKLDDAVGLHPSMGAAKALFDDGRLAVVQGVGYPNPNRSHFDSMRIWHTANPTGQSGYGWLGRALDRRAARGGAFADAVYVGESDTPLALWGRRSTATAMARADDMRLEGDPSRVGPLSRGGGPLAQFVSRQVLSAYASAEEFGRRQREPMEIAKSYPDTKLAAHLKLAAQLIRTGAAARVYYAVQRGYDTHAAQLYTHSRLLREFSDALRAFLDDLKADGLDQRVVVLAFSEFGRRVKENASQGTDHGAAGPVFVAGGKVKGGVVGDAPDLANLVQGDLPMQIDFRQVYASLLDDWLMCPSRGVLGGQFEKLRLV